MRRRNFIQLSILQEAPLLLIVNPGLVPGPLLIVSLLVSLAVAWLNRAGLQQLDLKSAMFGSVPGAIGVVWILPLIDQEMTSLIVGTAVITSISAAMLGWKIRQTKSSLAISGILAGALSTIAATPGPPMIIVYRTMEVHRYRANLSLFFSVSNLISCGSLRFSGGLGLDILKESLTLIPSLIIGVLIAPHLVKHMPGRMIRPVALSLCLISGIALLAKWVVS